MAKEMRCAEIMPGCNFVATGATDDEVMRKAAQHAKEKHSIKEITPDLARKVRAAIHDLATGRSVG
jgi:predicted small metal-binding protein